MALRARVGVFRPCIEEQLAVVKARCKSCHTNAPSNPSAPHIRLPEVVYPFQKVCGEFFEGEGRYYLVLVDRFLGWPLVASMPKASAAEFINVTKEFFLTFGIAEVVTSDGGLQFTSKDLRQFFLHGESANGSRLLTTHMGIPGLSWVSRA